MINSQRKVVVKKVMMDGRENGKRTNHKLNLTSNAIGGPAKLKIPNVPLCCFNICSSLLYPQNTLLNINLQLCNFVMCVMFLCVSVGRRGAGKLSHR